VSGIPGTKRGRGRPKKKPPGGCPELDGTLATVALANRWLFAGLASSAITTSDAREITASIRTEIMHIRTREQVDEMENLRKLVERQEAALRERKAREVGDRHTRTEVGEFAVEDEQEKA
jgi:hypothetical protein